MPGVKSLPLILNYLTNGLRQRSNIRLLAALLVLFAALVTLYSVVFHWLMAREGQSHSWPTSVYWTLVTMTTLGFGDITFVSDAGRVFSVVVLLSGTLFLLVLLPFSFIQFVFLPWMRRRDESRAPRRLPESTAGHIVLTSLGPVEDALIRRAQRAEVPYVVIVPEPGEALRLHAEGISVMVGDLDDPEAYRAARVEAAALVGATRADTANANTTFTVREITPTVPVVATVSNPASADILELAGATLVVQLGEILGRAMAERALAPDGLAHVIGTFSGLHIAEARVAGTSLSGRTLGEADLRADVGVGVLGVWDRGGFTIGRRDTRLDDSAVLVLAGSEAQLDRYNRHHATGMVGTDRALIIGGGRVGRAAATAFAARDTEYRIIEERPERCRDARYVQGNAADLSVLEAAGLREASAVLVTTHDDDMNIYLSIYCRRLRPDLRVVSRANLERNVSTLYRAGADDVLSYASTGAAAMWEHFRQGDLLLLAEGLSIFRAAVPSSLVGTTLADSRLREDTACSVVAVLRPDGADPNPPPSTVLGGSDSLLLIGDAEGEARFAERFPAGRRRGRPAEATVRSPASVP
jgi:voltage-gated potassium channel